jgi:NADPH:quinone reductase
LIDREIVRVCNEPISSSKIRLRLFENLGCTLYHYITAASEGYWIGSRRKISSMQACIVNACGGPDVAQWIEQPTPIPTPDEVLVEMVAVGLNPADANQIAGVYPGGPKPPFVPGRDGAGIVATPDAAGRFRAGDAVVVVQSASTSLVKGTLSEFQAIRAENLAPLPRGWTFAQGATPLVYQTAWQALQLAEMRPRKTVVVTGASGGVGLAALQLAKALQGNVIALTRDLKNAERLCSLGADVVYSSLDPQLKAAIQAQTKQLGADLVIENIGGDYMGRAVNWLGIGGTVSCVGVLAGTQATFSIPSVMFKQLAIRGVIVTSVEAQSAQIAWQQLTTRLAEQNFTPVIDTILPKEQLAEGFSRLSQSPFGKIVVGLQPDRANSIAH